ncbi:urease accessory protein UreF [Spongiibacter taiwanensis]|uniref:urease accessory protein UreF n=1 Tax=Spongiibacter taiwanensis TaxID=1748242 RepID=UPI002034AC9E|nr:urease accessory UreF family protein [Spongiibacter taiwanensis]USA44748.1 urease accessory protein UreF [Spongiibacter taiwanensis]
MIITAIRIMVILMANAPLLHLMQLVSPALPVGAYAYSQGLEFAVDQGWVNSLAAAEDWIGSVLEHSLGGLDLPVLQRLYRAYASADTSAATYWNDYLQSARESHELLLEDVQMGEALHRLLVSLDIAAAKVWSEEHSPSFATVFALAAVHWQVNEADAMQGFAWSWLENQVAAAIKLVPLGQTDGQRLLLALMPRLERAVAAAKQLVDEDIGVGLPRLAMASAQHETQYSRLFRS